MAIIFRKGALETTCPRLNLEKEPWYSILYTGKSLPINSKIDEPDVYSHC